MLYPKFWVKIFEGHRQHSTRKFSNNNSIFSLHEDWTVNQNRSCYALYIFFTALESPKCLAYNELKIILNGGQNNCVFYLKFYYKQASKLEFCLILTNLSAFLNGSKVDNTGRLKMNRNGCATVEYIGFKFTCYQIILKISSLINFNMTQDAISYLFLSSIHFVFNV